MAGVIVRRLRVRDRAGSSADGADGSALGRGEIERSAAGCPFDGRERLPVHALAAGSVNRADK